MPIHENYFTYLLNCGDYYERRYVQFDTPAEMFENAARCIAFDDLSDDVFESCYVDGNEYLYAGWQPGMVYEFIDEETGKVVYSTCHPEWDHQYMGYVDYPIFN